MASTRLTRSISSTGSRQKFTYSAWIKRGTLPSSDNLFCKLKLIMLLHMLI